MPNHNEPYDPLAAILHDDDYGAEQLRERVLSQTIGVVRTRRRVRQVRSVSLWLGCFVAGMFTMRLLSSTPAENPPPPQPIARATPVAEKKSVAPTVARSAYEVQRRYGDRDLGNPRRVESAVYRYSRAIALASNEQRAIDPEKDSWLLMALKLDQNQDKEKRHARD